MVRVRYYYITNNSTSTTPRYNECQYKSIGHTYIGKICVRASYSSVLYVESLKFDKGDYFMLYKNEWG